MLATDEEKARERKRRKLSLFTSPNNKYGYQLNVNNPVINKFYEDYIRRFGILRPPSDKQRIDFERALWGYIRRLYKKAQPDVPDVPQLPKEGHISTVFFGWQEEWAELFVNNTLAGGIENAVLTFRKVKIGGEVQK